MLTIYKASAGSGKTFTLTYRYIKLLLGYKDEAGRYRLRKKPQTGHRSILAVTFTNKATDEMKRRIVHELAVLGGMEPGWDKPSPYAATLVSELRCSEQELAAASRMALRNLLFDYNFFQVSTIDSFFQLILRTFAREAELTGNYEVDLDNDRAMESGVRSLFDSLRADPSDKENARMIDWLSEYLLTELRQGRGVALFNRRSGAFGQLMNFVRCTNTEEFKQHYAEMMTYLAKPDMLASFLRQLDSAPRRHKTITSNACAKALEQISFLGYDSGKLKVDSNVMKRLVNGEKNGYDTSKTEGKTIAKVLDNPMAAFTAELRKKLAAEGDEAAVADKIAAAITHLAEGRKMRTLWAELTKQLYNLGMLGGVYKFIDAFRSENNTLLLSDTNTMLREIIGDGDTPFVFERIGVWLDHFLIDEFQDTSGMQWEILRPLVMEGQATDSDSLIIGDEKQCIYRFRSSDPTLLQHRVEQEFGTKASVEGDTPERNTNWRSSSHVVEFNNALFARLAHSLGVTDVYANVRQNVSKPHVDHCGHIVAREIADCKIDDFADMAIDMLTDDIRRQLRAGYRGKDIAVLVRKRSHGSRVIAHLIKLAATDPDFKGLRVISDDAMMLADAPAVKLIISVLRYLDTVDMPAETDQTTESAGATESAETSRRRRAKTVACELQKMLNRYEFARSRGLLPSEALQRAISPTADAGLDLRSDVGNMECFNLPSLIERIISRMLDEELQSQCLFISAFQDAVADYAVSGNTDIHSFLDWWDSKGCRSTVSAPDDDNALRVMTIHKSKGLEFGCVHIPMLAYDMVSFRDSEWFAKAAIPMVDSSVVPPLLSIVPSKQLLDTAFEDQYRSRCHDQMLDELNILYVAMTRATDELCFTYLRPSTAGDRAPVGAIVGDALDSLGDLMQRGEPEKTSITSPDGSEATIAVTTATFGQPTSAGEAKTKKPTALDPVSTFDMPAYATADRDDLWAGTRIEDLPDYDNPRDRGIALHKVLARVRHTDSLPHAVDICRHAGLIPADLAASVAADLAAQLARPEISPWFDDYDRALCERTILLADGSHLRPDRVVWTADGHIDVIDYKFGERLKAHSDQVARYMQLLRSMGHANVRGFLWYVDEGAVLPVTP